ncbi:MAG: hypothetical protein Q7R72_01895 [bacterium]|nr:hypothetical protein [bacterium]
MKNPESEKQSENCPAIVYGNRQCTVPVKSGAEIGWMIWGRRVVAVVLRDGFYVPLNLADKVLSQLHHGSLHETA